MANEPMTSIGSARWLAGAMQLDSASGEQWSVAELSAILNHQLSAPIRIDLAKLGGDLVKRYDDAGGSAGLTFRELFTQPKPDVKLLQIVKDFSKQAIAQKDGSIPEEVGAALYYASISSAWLRCGGARISGLDEPTLLIGLNWVLGQPWLDASLRTLFGELAQQLTSQQPK